MDVIANNSNINIVNFISVINFKKGPYCSGKPISKKFNQISYTQ